MSILGFSEKETGRKTLRKLLELLKEYKHIMGIKDDPDDIIPEGVN